MYMPPVYLRNAECLMISIVRLLLCIPGKESTPRRRFRQMDSMTVLKRTRYMSRVLLLASSWAHYCLFVFQRDMFQVVASADRKARQRAILSMPRTTSCVRHRIPGVSSSRGSVTNNGRESSRYRIISAYAWYLRLIVLFAVRPLYTEMNDGVYMLTQTPWFILHVCSRSSSVLYCMGFSSSTSVPANFSSQCVWQL